MGWVPDVSEHNGVVDWDRLAAAGPDAVIIRAGFGTVRADLQFARNWAEARRVGLRRIAYWFCYPAYNAAAAEAEMARSVVPLLPGDGLMGDFENDPNARPWPSNGLAWAESFLLAWAPAGYDPLWYASPAFIREHGLAGLSPHFPLCLAQWGVSTPDTMGLRTLLWQYTDCATTPGVTGYCDRSVALADLAPLFIGGAPAPPDSGGEGTMLLLRGSDGRAHRVLVAKGEPKLFEEGQVQGGPVHWIGVTGGTGGLDSWAGGDGELPGGGGWIAAGTLCAMLDPYQGRERLTVEGVGADGTIQQKTVTTDDYTVVEDWHQVAGPVVAVPGVAAGSGTLEPHTHTFSIPTIDGTTSGPHSS